VRVRKDRNPEFNFKQKEKKRGTRGGRAEKEGKYKLSVRNDLVNQALKDCM